MSEVHWADEYSAWLRGLIPELGGDPIYLRTSTELPPWMQVDHALAWYCAIGDLRLKPQLLGRNQWAGRGPLLCVSQEWLYGTQSQRHGILLHEASHAFEHPNWRTSEEDLPPIVKILIGEIGTAIIEAKAGPAPESGTTLESHGLAFVRCGLHLWWRARFSVDPWDMRLADDCYQLKPDRFLAAIKALMPELKSGGDLFQILETEAPEAFSKLF